MQRECAMVVYKTLFQLVTSAVFASLILFPYESKAEPVYYVKPTEPLHGDRVNHFCKIKRCSTLQEFLQRSTTPLFRPNTRVQFLTGKHALDLGSKDGFLKVYSARNITFAGESGVWRNTPIGAIPANEILCKSKVFFLFKNVNQLTIRDLTFINCGHIINAYALGFVNVIDAHISRVVVYNSSGFGIFGYNIGGVSSITESLLYGNRDGEWHPGGNAYFLFVPNNTVCSFWEKAAVNFTIQSSSFKHGYASRLSSTAGLRIIVKNSCSDTSIQIRNAIFDGNFYQQWNSSYSVGAQAGGNMVLNILETVNTSNFISIENSRYKHGYSAIGGGLLIHIQKNKSEFCPPNRSLNLINISNSIIDSNTAYFKGGGLSLSYYLGKIGSCHDQGIYLRNVTIERNHVHSSSSNGGNVYMLIPHRVETITVEMADCSIREGVAGQMGGGVFLSFALEFEYPEKSSPQSHGSRYVHIAHSDFSGNTAYYRGGGAVFDTQPFLDQSDVFRSEIKIDNCSFHNNSATVGSAFVAKNYVRLTTLFRSFDYIFTDICVGENKPLYSKTCPTCTNKKAIYLEDIENVTFINGQFRENSVGAIKVYNSNLFLEGNITFFRNTGYQGGGMELCSNSFIYLKQNTHVQFTENHAQRAGGAIYVKENECQSGRGEARCFFNLDQSYVSLPFNITAKISFSKNTAEVAGSALYGGQVDGCVPMIQIEQGIQYGERRALAIVDGKAEACLDTRGCDSQANESLTENNYLSDYKNGSLLFDNLFAFSNQTGLSVVSSNPVGVCLCEDNLPKCEVKVWNVSVYPGETFTISTVSVGQRNGVVPGVIRARLLNHSELHLHMLGDFQEAQGVGNFCKPVNYTVFSGSRSEEVVLWVDRPERIEPKGLANSLSLQSPRLILTLLDCPPGFTLSTSTPRQECSCVEELLRLGIICNIDRKTILKPPAMWIGLPRQSGNTTVQSPSTSILVHKHCPFDYCIGEALDIRLNESDNQCAFNRTGILCGACKRGLSLALATSRCIECSNTYLSLIPGFSLAGLLLIFILSVLNLTVAEGTLSGLIFYANTIHVNRDVFFHSKNVHFLATFVAWLNLDLGIETCFYDGMDASARTWLQFAFPLYMWGVVIFMIVSSHFSIMAGKLFGRNNSVRVLATLLLLSYTKILRTVITALSFTYLTYPDASIRFLWLADANVQYLHGQHIPLFSVALIFLVFLFVPYTVLLLLIQCLQKSDHKALHWVNKIKPFLDAYSGPYKNNYRFWPGFLLLVRTVGLAVNILGDPVLDLLILLVTAMCLLGLKLFSRGIYIKRATDNLETLFFLILALLTATTLYIQVLANKISLQDIVTGVFVGLSFLIFAGILIFHVRKYTKGMVFKLKNTQLLRCFKRKKDNANDSLYTGLSGSQSLLKDAANGSTENDALYTGESGSQSHPQIQCLRLMIDVASGEVELIEDVQD